MSYNILSHAVFHLSFVDHMQNVKESPCSVMQVYSVVVLLALSGTPSFGTAIMMDPLDSNDYCLQALQASDTNRDGIVDMTEYPAMCLLMSLDSTVRFPTTSFESLPLAFQAAFQGSACMCSSYDKYEVADDETCCYGDAAHLLVLDDPDYLEVVCLRVRGAAKEWRHQIQDTAANPSDIESMMTSTQRSEIFISLHGWLVTIVAVVVAVFAIEKVAAAGTTAGWWTCRLRRSITDEGSSQASSDLEAGTSTTHPDIGDSPPTTPASVYVDSSGGPPISSAGPPLYTPATTNRHRTTRSNPDNTDDGNAMSFFVNADEWIDVGHTLIETRPFSSPTSSLGQGTTNNGGSHTGQMLAIVRPGGSLGALNVGTCVPTKVLFSNGSNTTTGLSQAGQATSTVGLDGATVNVATSVVSGDAGAVPGPDSTDGEGVLDRAQGLLE